MANVKARKEGRLSRFVWQGLAGLSLIIVAMMAIGFLVGIVKWVVSVALFLAAGYVVWRIFKAVVL
jgi:ABC-type polysaccharide/polyol phosphate export permease